MSTARKKREAKMLREAGVLMKTFGALPSIQNPGPRRFVGNPNGTLIEIKADAAAR